MSHPFVLVTDRGGHLQNAQMLIEQMGHKPAAIITTQGPEVVGLQSRYDRVVVIPTLFTFFGKRRFTNPWKIARNFFGAVYWAWKLRPRAVISLGATNVVFFCYFARLFGGKIFHVECMNQVTSPSITGRVLYPICEKVFVQWPELLDRYGPRASYQGWVI